MLVQRVCCVASGLCEGLITLSDDSYRLCVSKCVRYKNFNKGRPDLGCSVRDEKRYTYISQLFHLLIKTAYIKDVVGQVAQSV
jgi:hypothetical protein